MGNFAVYYKDVCPYCVKVKEIFEMTGQNFREYKLGVDFTREEFYNQFGAGSTFPRVVLNDKLIGGCTETVKWLQEQKVV